MATLHEEISGVLISYIGALDKFVDATNKVAKLVEAYSASANKLQAEIAALIPAVEACSGYARNGEAVRSVVAKMRQLSAVQ